MPKRKNSEDKKIDEKKAIDKVSPSPDQIISEEDAGDEVQKRFKYQHTYGAIIAIEMYSENLKYKEILCEQHEDILGVREDDTYDGIQIKTRQLSDGPFELTDEAIGKTLKRFVGLDKKFPGKFRKYVLVSNCDFRDDDTSKSLRNLLVKVREPNSLEEKASAKRFRKIYRKPNESM